MVQAFDIVAKLGLQKTCGINPFDAYKAIIERLIWDKGGHRLDNRLLVPCRR